MTSRDPLIGQEIGEYRIQSVLGRGGMGIVYEAEDTALGITVALKMIDPALARDATFVRRFRAEARAMARIASPHIVRVMAMRQTEHGLFIVMEYVDGGTLYDRMQEGPVSWEAAWPILDQILQALEKAHGVGVIHRDIKPRNIMLTGDGKVKVTDFGLAKMVSDDPSITVTQAVAGTLLYMSPEQVRASGNVDQRSDLFALGLLAYEMLAGRLPFDRDAGEFAVMRAIVEQAFPPPTKFAPTLAAPVGRGLMKALEKEPSRRYGSAAEMREALALVAPSERTDRRARAPKAGFSTSALFVAGGAVVVVLMAALILWVVLPGGTTDEAIADTRTQLSTEAESLTPLDAQLTLEADIQGPEEPNEILEPQPQVEPDPAPAPAAVRPGSLEVAPQAGVIYTVAGSRIESMRSLSPGAHTVRCEAGGHAAQTRVQIQSGQSTRVTCYTEQPVNVGVAFESGPASWVSILVNGEPIGRQTPARLTLGPGRHVISVQRDGYETLTPDQVVTVEPSFSPHEPVPLSFRVRPTT